MALVGGQGKVTETTPLRSSGTELSSKLGHSQSRLDAILAAGRRQARMLPPTAQPGVNALIKFVEMHNMVKLFAYAALAVAFVALGLSLLSALGECIDADYSSIYLLQISTVLGIYVHSYA